MSDSQPVAAPESGISDPEFPTLDELLADPEITALLDFEPVPRKVKLKNGWSGELQREFIARLAVHGSPSSAAGEVGKDVTSARKLYKSPLGESFRGAWDAAVEPAERRIAERTPVARIAAGARPPAATAMTAATDATVPRSVPWSQPTADTSTPEPAGSTLLSSARATAESEDAAPKISARTKPGRISFPKSPAIRQNDSASIGASCQLEC